MEGDKVAEKQQTSYTYWVRDTREDAAPLPVPRKLTTADISKQAQPNTLGSVWNQVPCVFPSDPSFHHKLFSWHCHLMQKKLDRRGRDAFFMLVWRRLLGKRNSGNSSVGLKMYFFFLLDEYFSGEKFDPERTWCILYVALKAFVRQQ